MKPAAFSFAVDHARHLVQIRMGGFFDADDIARFDAARHRAHQTLRCGPNEHVTLVDMREMQIQSQEAVALFSAVIHNPHYIAARLAIVVTQTLARLQVKRAADGRDVRYFTDDTVAARRWLIEQPQPGSDLA